MSSLRKIGRINLPNLEPNAVPGGAPACILVNPCDLYVEEQYQRSLSDKSIKLIRKLVRNWNWAHMKPPICVRSGEKLFVVDGQHTAMAAASHPDIKEIPIMIVAAAEVRDRARAFVAHNTAHVRVTSVQIFFSELAAGDEIGGCPVLGYDVDLGGGRLIVNEEEAERVRAIFALFEEHRSILPTLAEIERRGWRLKSWVRKTGQFRPGGPFALHSLRRLLTNILYTGAIRHKGQPYPGEHAAILAPGTWERVQTLMTHRAAFARGRSRNKHLALLSGLLYCECCVARMVYSYAGKSDRKYPYYVCLNAQRRGWAVCPAKSLPARGIEESVLGQIRQAQRRLPDPAEWEQMGRTEQVEAIQAVVERVGYDGALRQISIRFHPAPIQTTGGEVRP